MTGLKEEKLSVFLDDQDRAIVEKVREYLRSRGSRSDLEYALTWILFIGMDQARKWQDQ